MVISTPKMLLNHLKLYSDNILKSIHTFIVDEADLVGYGSLFKEPSCSLTVTRKI